MQLSDNAIGVYVALRKIQQSKTEKFYISINMILFVLFGSADYKRSDRQHISDGLSELIKEKIVVIAHTVSSTEYILEPSPLIVNKSINEDDYFVKIASKELYFIMNCNVDSNKRGLSRLSLLRYFIVLIGTINFYQGIYIDCAGGQKTNFVGYIAQKELCRLSGIVKNTLLSFNEILEENNIIYIFHHKKNRVFEDGTRRSITNHYGRYSDKEYIQKFALEYEKNLGIAEKIVDAQSNRHKKLANNYYALCNGKGLDYDDELIKEIYNYIHKCNLEIQKEIDKKNEQLELTQSDEEYLKKLRSKLRNESIFDKYEFLFSKDQYIWGDKDYMEFMPTDIF